MAETQHDTPRMAQTHPFNSNHVTPEKAFFCLLFAEGEEDLGDNLCDSDSCLQPMQSPDLLSRPQDGNEALPPTLHLDSEDELQIKKLAKCGRRLGIKDRDFMDRANQPELRPWMRDELVQFAIQLSENLDIDTHTTMVCISCLDRVLCSVPVSKSRAQCLLVTCFLIAVKFGEWYRMNPGIDYLVAATSN